MGKHKCKLDDQVYVHKPGTIIQAGTKKKQNIYTVQFNDEKEESNVLAVHEKSAETQRGARNHEITKSRNQSGPWQL